MEVRIFWLRIGDAPRLGIMPRPRGGDWLQDEIACLQRSQVDVLVSLLEPYEEVELDLRDERAVSGAAGIGYLSFPIADRQVPESIKATCEFVGEISRLLLEGRRIVIHCRQGIGRSALMAACIMARQGIPVPEAFSRIAESRGCAVADTEEQRSWVEKFLDATLVAHRLRVSGLVVCSS